VGVNVRARAPLAPKAVHRRRLVGAGKLGLVLVVGALAIGITGYMALEGLGFVDAFLNAAMILSGMGPLHNPVSTAGKLFAGFYALFSGFAVLGIAAIVFAPIVHRIFHRLHIADTEAEERAEAKAQAKDERKADPGRRRRR
jgi:hypothetical protein